MDLPLCSHVERLRMEEGESGRRSLDRSSYHHAIASLEDSSEDEEEEGRKKRVGFLRPIVETESTFRPANFGSRLLPEENKPLEMQVLKRAKELLLSHGHQSIARHLLKADCQVTTPTLTCTGAGLHLSTTDSRQKRITFDLLQVARITNVTPEMRSQMGVVSGLELVTLPHGHQLRLDLMERYAHACTHTV